jgi:hypothetical protein
MLSLLTSSKFWLILALAVSNAFSYFKGHSSGYAEGYGAGHQEFLVFKEQALESAMAEQVRRNEIEATLKTANQKVTENYVSLQAATSTAVRALDADRLRALAALTSARGGAAPLNTSTGLPANATAEDGVLSECFRRYEEVAGDAEQLSSQVTALQDYITKVVPQ